VEFTGQWRYNRDNASLSVLSDLASLDAVINFLHERFRAYSTVQCCVESG